MGIKSFQGKRETNQEKMGAQILVSDYMTTNLITFKAEDSLDHVIAQLIAHKISGGPVVNDKNELIGIISEGDCLKQIIKGKYNNYPNLNGSVKEHMITEVQTLQSDNTILEAATAFLEQRIRRFPVLENGKLVGQISQRDVMKAIEDFGR